MASPSRAGQKTCGGRPLSAPLGMNAGMQVLDGGAGYRAPRQGSAQRKGSAGRSRAQPSPRRTDTQSLQVRRRGDEPSIPDVSETGLVGQLPYIKVERPSSAQQRAAEMREFGLDSVAATVEAAPPAVAAPMPAPGAAVKVDAVADALAGRRAEAAAAERAQTAAGQMSLETRLADVQRNQRRRELEAYMEELQQKAETGAVEMPDNFFGEEAEAKMSARREARAALPEPEPEPEPQPQLEPEPEPEPEQVGGTFLTQTMAAATELTADSISMEGAADPGDMDELDRRLRALQATQDRRRGELDDYMSQLQRKEVEGEDGGAESLV